MSNYSSEICYSDMYSEFEEKKDDRSQNNYENSTIIGSIVFWSVQFTVPVYC